MKKLAGLFVFALIVLLGGALYYRNWMDPNSSAAVSPRRGGGQIQVAVELAAPSRTDMFERISVVGNLVGAATVEAVPKISGRLQSVLVRLGDQVRRGQPIAQVEDREIREQVNQAEASLEVAAATLRQREADLRLIQTSLERYRELFREQLVARQILDEAEARYQVTRAQLDLANAQHVQTKSRLEELRINLANTVITSPVDGFVGKRDLDPGAWVTPSSSFISIVDIHPVRMVANIIEKDIKRISLGLAALIEVDAYPGETFAGHIRNVAPVLDPATRTAQVEIEVPNPQSRLKPGMYARVVLTTNGRRGTMAVPTGALVRPSGKLGVFLIGKENVTEFREVQTGLEDESRNLVEIVSGIQENDRIVTAGAATLRDGDRVILPGQRPVGAGAPAQMGTSKTVQPNSTGGSARGARSRQVGPPEAGQPPRP